MFRIISSSRYKYLLTVEGRHATLLSKLSQAYRWLSEFTHMEPLWDWLKHDSPYGGISDIRDDIRREYDTELSRKGYSKGK